MTAVFKFGSPPVVRSLSGPEPVVPALCHDKLVHLYTVVNFQIVQTQSRYVHW